MSILDGLLAAIDRISEWSGTAVGYLLLPVAGVMMYEVVARYGFNAPTIWSTEIVVILAGTFYVVGGAYTHRLHGHISVDTLYDMLSPRWQAATRVLVHFPLFCLYVGVLLWGGTEFAWDSVQENERSGSLWNPIVWPFKLVLPLGAFLLLLQGVAHFVRDVRSLLTGEGLEAGPAEEFEADL